MIMSIIIYEEQVDMVDVAYKFTLVNLYFENFISLHITLFFLSCFHYLSYLRASTYFLLYCYIQI
jgi:hypothetical protein